MINLKKIVTKVRLTFTLNLIAATIVASLASAKSYADGLKDALVAGERSVVRDAVLQVGTRLELGRCHDLLLRSDASASAGSIVP